MTPAEERLQPALQGRNAEGLKIRRQHPIGPDVVDFAVPAARLCIELDGGIHAEQTEADAAPTENLAAAGHGVLRFPNERIFRTIDAVLHELTAIVRATPQA